MIAMCTKSPTPSLPHPFVYGHPDVQNPNLNRNDWIPNEHTASAHAAGNALLVHDTAEIPVEGFPLYPCPFQVPSSPSIAFALTECPATQPVGGLSATST